MNAVFQATAEIMKARVLVQLVAGGTKKLPKMASNCGWRKVAVENQQTRERKRMRAMCHVP